MEVILRTKVVSIPAYRIVDWDTFHDVFAEALGFPSFYGRNLNAWIDCLTDADAASGMVADPVARGDLLTLGIANAADFKRRCPEQFDALIDCAAFVNSRRREQGDSPVLALLMDGDLA